jgi:hypothetical protein
MQFESTAFDSVHSGEDFEGDASGKVRRSVWMQRPGGVLFTAFLMLHAEKSGSDLLKK